MSFRLLPQRHGGEISDTFCAWSPQTVTGENPYILSVVVSNCNNHDISAFQLHTGEEPYVLCSNRTTYVYSFSTGEKSYFCQACNNKLLHTSVLNHKLHTGEKPQVCINNVHPTMFITFWLPDTVYVERVPPLIDKYSFVFYSGN